MSWIKYMGILTCVAACTTTQVEPPPFQDEAFTSASYDRDLAERDSTLRNIEKVSTDAQVTTTFRRDFYLPDAQLKNLKKRSDLARQRLNSQSIADSESLRILAIEALSEGRPEQVPGFLKYAKSKKGRRNLHSDDRVLLAIAAFQMGDFSEAKRQLGDSLGDASVSAVARANLGLVALKQGAYLEALEMFRQAEALEPKNTRFLHMVAESAHAARKHSIAVEKYRRIIALDHDDLLARYNLGLVYHYGLKRYADARREFQFVIDRPNAPRSVRVLADGAFANVRREEEGVQGIATTGFQ